MSKKVILYHAECPDGFGAAWAAWKKFGGKAEYIPIRHQTPPPKGLKNREIYLLDITYFGKDLEKLLESNYVTTIDHHESAKAAITKAHQYHYALERSGAALAWQFFQGKAKIPKLLLYVEGQDLWRFNLPKAREILAVINTTPFKFKNWDAAARAVETAAGRSKYAEIGKNMLRCEKHIVSELASKAEPGLFCGKRAGIVNCPSSALKSEIGHALNLKGFPVGLIWGRSNGRIKVSLRSNGKIDVSKMAQRFGGGGHKSAAGFALPPSAKIPWKYKNG